MARKHADIVVDLRAFAPPADDWDRLNDLAAELWKSGSPADAIPDLLGVFERFPDAESFGVFWSILHGLESLPGYEAELVRSVQRRPSEFGVLMVGRLLNAGRAEAAGTPLLPLLQSVAARPGLPERVRRTAQLFAEKHATRPSEKPHKGGGNDHDRPAGE